MMWPFSWFLDVQLCKTFPSFCTISKWWQKNTGITGNIHVPSSPLRGSAPQMFKVQASLYHIGFSLGFCLCFNHLSSHLRAFSWWKLFQIIDSGFWCAERVPILDLISRLTWNIAKKLPSWIFSVAPAISLASSSAILMRRWIRT